LVDAALAADRAIAEGSECTPEAVATRTAAADSTSQRNGQPIWLLAFRCCAILIAMARKRTLAYTVVLEEEPIGNWHAYAPAVRGCFAGGKTRSEALRRFRSALRLHLSELAASGAVLPIERRAAAVQVVVAA